MSDRDHSAQPNRPAAEVSSATACVRHGWQWARDPIEIFELPSQRGKFVALWKQLGLELA